MSKNYPIFVKRDLDGFFGLFIDNLVQLLAIVFLCGSHCGMSGESARFLIAYILPGAALSLIVGNVFYAWQAHRLAAREGRDDITALPYGINTPSLLVYIFFVMGPAFRDAKGLGLSDDAAAAMAWKLGLVACLGSGIIEFAGSFVAERIRKSTPRAALLSTLAGIAIGFISMTFALQIFQKPLVAMLPLAVVLITYFSRTRFPLGLPGGLIAVVLGTAMAWLMTVVSHFWIDAPEWSGTAAMNPKAVFTASDGIGVYAPQFVGGEIWQILAQPKQWIGYLSVIIPMGLFNVIGSLQNIESAEASGDSFDTRSSLAVNGVGTIAAALFGSCFPTTIYIGHPGWKGLGARAGYSTLNGIVVTAICLTGTVGLINSIVPMEAGIAIVLWIGIVITAQAFQATPKEHAPAVAMGLFPAIAAWGMTVAHGSFLAAGGTTMQQLLSDRTDTLVNGFLLHAMISIERGYIFTCMILSAISVCLIDRRFTAAGIWATVAALFAMTGLTHAYQLGGNSFDFLYILQQPDEGSLAFRGTGIAVGYLLFAALAFAMGRYSNRIGAESAH